MIWAGAGIQYRLLSEILYHIKKTGEFGGGGLGEGRDLRSDFDCLKQGHSAAFGVVEDFVDGGFTDAPRRGIDDSQESDLVGGIDDDLEIREDVADFLSVVEFDAADDLIGDFIPDEGLFERAALGVDPVKYGDIGRRCASATSFLIFSATPRASSASSSNGSTTTFPAGGRVAIRRFSFRLRLLAMRESATSRMPGVLRKFSSRRTITASGQSRSKSRIFRMSAPRQR